MFDWITNVIGQTGYLGIALLMLAENIFPAIPSEVIMPVAGFTAARGDLNIFLVIAAGAAGSLVGALGWYYVGRLVPPDRIKALASHHGRWMAIHPGEVNRAREWLDRYGHLSVFIGRLVPTIRTLISIPAGIIGMPLGTFLFYSALGTSAWTALLAAAGYLFQDGYESVAVWLDPLTVAVFFLIAAIYLYRVITFDAADKRN